MKAYRSAQKHERTGKPILTFNPLKAVNSTNPISLPCNGCIGCRLDRIEQWSVRCSHEAKMHEYNSFITLTYTDEALPEDYGLDPREIQLFLKRLRKDLNCKIRFFLCGEYAPETLRPHYHGLIFGYAFPDRKLWSKNDGNPTFTSDQLERAWPHGRCIIGDLTPQSARYVAGYSMKKIGGDRAAAHYSRQHPRSGQTYQVHPEFQRQSLGIGRTWYDKFKGDAFPSDFLVVDGKQTLVPRYYFLKLREEEQIALQRQRKLKASKPAKKWNRTSGRLRVREEVQASRIKQLKRDGIK